MSTNKITQEARLRCATHTLAEQLSMYRELERQKIIEESTDRIIRDAEELAEPMRIDGAD